MKLKKSNKHDPTTFREVRLPTCLGGQQTRVPRPQGNDSLAKSLYEAGLAMLLYKVTRLSGEGELGRFSVSVHKRTR